MAFDDGTPLDAAKLQALETAINNVKASIPQIGSSTVNIDASVNQSVAQAQIVAGITSSALNVPAKGDNTQTITFSGLSSAPIAVSVTPFKTSGSLSGITWAVYGAPTSSSCIVKVWNSSSTQQSLRFSWIAVCGNK